MELARNEKEWKGKGTRLKLSLYLSYFRCPSCQATSLAQGLLVASSLLLLLLSKSSSSSCCCCHVWKTQTPKEARPSAKPPQTPPSIACTSQVHRPARWPGPARCSPAACGRAQSTRSPQRVLFARLALRLIERGGRTCHEPYLWSPRFWRCLPAAPR